MFRQDCFIGGHWTKAASGKSLAVTNPATAEIIGRVPQLGREETRSAIQAAQQAYLHWRQLTAKERAQVLRRWYDLIMAHQEDLAVIMTVEQGKPLAESRGEIAYAAPYVEWFAEEGKGSTGTPFP